MPSKSEFVGILPEDVTILKKTSVTFQVPLPQGCTLYGLVRNLACDIDHIL